MMSYRLFRGVPCDKIKMWIAGWLLLAFAETNSGQHGCEMVSSISGYALTRHTYQRKTGIRLLTCVVTCQDDVRCYSINFKFTFQECELNNGTRFATPQNFVPSPDTVYLDNLYRPYKPCDNAPCQNGGSCLTVEESPGFECKCYPGYTGKTCEGCSYPNSRALGMSSGEIKDDQVNATSYMPGYEAYQARLHGQSCWRSNSNRQEFLEIHFAPSTKYVTALATQGDPQANNWITRFKIAYSAGGIWKDFKQLEDEPTAIFEANDDRYSVATHEFNNGINATALRIYPLGCRNRIALRVEIYGC